MNPPVLARAKTLVDPALREAVQTLVHHLRLPASYHLGWCEADGSPATHDAGKGVRGALAVLGAEAVGSQADAALPGAVAVELIHNFSLIHDDIMDNDEMRRHRPTVWHIFGVADAILVGDALHALAFEVLTHHDEPAANGAIRRLAQATAAMIAGQSQDVALDGADTASVADCIAMEANKTGALLAQSIAIGAVLGCGEPQQVDRLESYGAALGIAFQAVDDMLGIWGDPAKTGKAVGNDLREHKKSMPVAIALDRDDDIADRVRTLFAGPADDQAIRELTAHLADVGVRDEVEAIAAHHLGLAIEALNHVDLDDQARAELIELAEFVTRRSV